MKTKKYIIWNACYGGVFDDKKFDTYKEAEKYFEDNLDRIYALCDEYCGRPTDIKDYFWIDEVKENEKI